MFLGSFMTYSQQALQVELNDPYFPPPEATSLGKFGFTPADNYTGIPNVQIPVWNIKGGQIDHPVSLIYNYNGLKVTEEASWVGLGWTLQVGGVIQQVPYGISDYKTLGFNDRVGVAVSGPFLVASYDEIPVGIEDYLLYNRVANKNYDGSPDIFVYSFNGMQGKFYFINGEIVPLTYTDAKFTYDRDGKTFTIVDGNGTTYLFEKYDESSLRVINADIANGIDYLQASISYSWRLTRMISADLKDFINFNYSSIRENIQSPTFYDRTIISRRAQDITVREHCIANSVLQDPTATFTDSYQWRLESIESKYERLVFVPRTSSRNDLEGDSKALSKIMVYSKGNLVAPIREFIFTHGYFGGITDSKEARLRLTKFQETITGGDSKPPYKFVYYNQSATFPNKESFSIDHWGYYNGVIDNLILSPYDPAKIWRRDYVDANRSPNHSFAKYGMLEKIIFPTGGYDHFFYESNKYSFNNEERIGPGLRVSKIETYHGSGTPVVRKFEYSNPVFLGHPEYYSIYNYAVEYYVPPAGYGIGYTECNECTGVLIHGRNASLGPSNSANVYYTQIKEIFGENTGRGYTLHKYGLVKDLKYVSELRKLSEMHYSLLQADNYSTPVLRKGTQYYYTTLTVGQPRLVMDYLILQDKGFGCIGPFDNCVVGDGCAETKDPDYRDLPLSKYYSFSHELNTYWNRLDSTIEISSSGIGVIATKRIEKKTIYDYESIAHRYPTTITNIDSENDKNITYLKYPQSYSTDAAYNNDIYYNALKRMKDLNIVKPVIEKIDLVQENFNTFRSILSSKLALYKNFSTPGNPMLKLHKVLNMEITNPVPVSTGCCTTNFSNTSGNSMIYDPLYVERSIASYEDQGRIETIDRDGLKTTYLYNNQNFAPVAEVINANHNQVAYTSFEHDNTTDDGGWLSQGGTRFKSVGAITGNNYLKNQGGSSTTISLVNSLPLGVYTLTYWKQGNVSHNFTGIDQLNSEVILQRHGWSLIEINASVTNVTNGVSLLLGTNAQIDELRLMPHSAQMKTFSYDGSIGIISQNDQNNTFIDYFYDDLGRLLYVKDQDGNILQRYKYNYGFN